MKYTPLAHRLRPKNLEQFVGQPHLISSPQSPLNQILQNSDSPISSMIFWGPPGSGKTTLSKIILSKDNIQPYSISAVSSGIKDIQEIIQQSKSILYTQKQVVLFIDEIHRYSKTQQDALLEAVENGWIVLLGATTENPKFSINPSLLSRCQVFEFKTFDNEELKTIIQNISLELGSKFNDEVQDFLVQSSDGDARKLINLIDIVFQNKLYIEKKENLTLEDLQKILENVSEHYHYSTDSKYDCMSAFIKSIRGSDTDAALYYLARLIVGSEDPKYIARRLVISASEDIGLADPNALLLAEATLRCAQEIGYPEARIPLSECTIYLAKASKSNSAYLAINQAIDLVKKTGNLSVPIHLANQKAYRHTTPSEQKKYIYPHDFSDKAIPQDYLPKSLLNEKFYSPKKDGFEKKWLDENN